MINSLPRSSPPPNNVNSYRWYNKVNPKFGYIFFGKVIWTPVSKVKVAKLRAESIGITQTENISSC